MSDPKCELATNIFANQFSFKKGKFSYKKGSCHTQRAAMATAPVVGAKLTFKSRLKVYELKKSWQNSNQRCS